MTSINYKNLCPACGYDLGFESWRGNSASFEICPCCGIQFGYTDAAGGDGEKRKEIYREWRGQWIKGGMVWDKGSSPPPENWNSQEQLKNIPVEFR